MKHTIKIFLASSIVEFADVRDAIENYIWKLRDERGMDVMPVRCETADPSMSATRKEDDYCELIRQSDVCLFLFDQRLGSYSLEEYDYAGKLNREGNGPRILVYFRGNTLDAFKKQVHGDGFFVQSFNTAADVCASLLQKLGEFSPGETGEEQGQPVYIFLASSIKEDDGQRLKIENFIRRMNWEFHGTYGLSVRPLVLGEEDDDLDEVIRRSRMCFFIVFTRVDDREKSELKFAKQYFDRTGFPKIYVYFNALKEGESEQRSVAEFKDYLDRELKHFYGTFSGVDTIKLRILLNLAIQETGSKEVSFKDGKCYFGRDALFSVDNVSEFANNKKLAELKAQFSALSEEYHVCKREYEGDRADRARCEKFYDVGTRYHRLKKQIEELEEKIFGLSLSMSRDEVHGLITERQKRAYRRFEAGDVESAVEILDVDEALEEYRRAERYAKGKAAEVLSEGRLKIEFLKTMFRYKERFELIEETYEKLLPVATAQQTGLGIYDDYALFLAERDRHKEALEKALLLKTLYTVFPAVTDGARADNLTVLATISGKMSDQQKETEEYCLQSLSLRERIRLSDPMNEANNVGIAKSCLALGDLCRRAQRTDEARRYLKRAEDVFAEFEGETDRHLSDHVRALILTGQTYFDEYRGEQALACYRRAEELVRRLPQKDPREKYQLSSCYQNSAATYRKIGKKEEALRMFRMARDIRIGLNDEDPAGYMPALAYSCQGVGNALRSLGRFDEALEHYFQAYKLRKVVCEKNRGAHEQELSDSCAKIAGIYLDTDRADDALPYLKEAFEIRERLNRVSPQTYGKWYAQILFEYGRYCEHKRDMPAAERYYGEALDLRTRGEVSIAVNAEALHDSFSKMKQLFGEGYLQKLSPEARRVHDELYSYNASRPAGEHIVLDASYDD